MKNNDFLNIKMFPGIFFPLNFSYSLSSFSFTLSGELLMALLGYSWLCFQKSLWWHLGIPDLVSGMESRFVPYNAMTFLFLLLSGTNFHLFSLNNLLIPFTTTLFIFNDWVSYYFLQDKTLETFPSHISLCMCLSLSFWNYMIIM